MGDAEREAGPEMTSAKQMVGWLVLSLLIGFVGAAAWIRSTVPLVAIPDFTWTIPLVLAVGVLVSAWPVKAMADGKKRTMNPLTAARIAVFCQACSRGGMILAGICLGAWFAFSGENAVFLNEQASAALWAGVGSLVLAGAGWLGEWWCSIDDDDDDAPAAAQGA